MYTTDQIIRLARIYIGVTGTTASRLGTRVANNDRLFTRLFEGHSCRLAAAEQACWWFNENWPSDCPWPTDIERRTVRRPRLRRSRRKVPVPASC